LWYASPFRAEKEPSFHTSFLGGKWIWNDFGDIGGTVVDFAMRYNGFQSIKDTLAWLDRVCHTHPIQRNKGRVEEERAETTQPSLFSFQQQSGAAAPVESDLRQLEFVSAQPISNPVILDYLSLERCIPGPLVLHYLQEVTYRNLGTGKTFFAFGMLNKSGGYEIRAASDKVSFKSALIARDITVIDGSSPERGIVNVFEGMTDFLSFLTMMKLPRLAGDAVIMHSLSSYARASEFIHSKGYRVINTFLDNDSPGREGTERFRREFSDQVVSQSEMFADYKDLNDALRANQTRLQPGIKK
jgi:hypothetical protein